VGTFNNISTKNKGIIAAGARAMIGKISGLNQGVFSKCPLRSKSAVSFSPGFSPARRRARGTAAI
jgi:hypothetical protein